jgi:hypothetical protein
MSLSNDVLRDDYDDEKALDAYIARNVSHYLNEPELRGYWLSRKVEAMRHNAEYAPLYQEMVAREPQEVVETVKRGSAAIYDEVKDRFLTGQLQANRCPKCNRIVRTPHARQCLWCGHDWHQADAL